jgi:hypothetical protein
MPPASQGDQESNELTEFQMRLPCGCDVFTFRGDKIVVKNTYRKQRG